MSYYDVQQVCINGHQITASYSENPVFRKDHCPACGKITIHKCPNCDNDIKGKYVNPKVAVIGVKTKVPHYCDNCGEPFPWTKSSIEAVKEISEELEGLSEKEHSDLKENIDLVLTDNPKTELGVVKIKKILKKATGTIIKYFDEKLTDIASETAAKLLKQ